MRVIENIKDLKAIVRSQKQSGKTIGFVPTMGYLHEGHISLAKKSVSENDFTIMSIFVNPTQFGPKEDFSEYPRNMEKDTVMAENAGVDVVFSPTEKEMYPYGYNTYVNVEQITDTLCGESRPGHFKGVATVVTKLFNIVEPDKAYFGQKDAQQAVVIKRMVRDLNMSVEIITCPIIREQDGLAMSSRNTYLNEEERKAALILSKSLLEAERLVKSGEKNSSKIIKHIKDMISAEKLANVEYIKIVDQEDLRDVNEIDKKALIALAVRFGSTRLIDNIEVEV